MSSATTNQPFVFSPTADHTRVDVVGDTRREIADIVREVAGAVRSNRSATEFISLLADRTLRAMAAEGVVLWQQKPSSSRLSYRCVHRLGRVTDQSLTEVSMGTHDRLIVEVGSEGSPVVVPATPGATDPEVPCNPTDVPAALAPIDSGASLAGADYVLEVFLEPGGGVATQRGYLRFVAQMADLAGEFFRADQLRVLRREQELATKVDDIVARMHRVNDPQKLQSMIVDEAAQTFGFDRVGLIRHKDLIAVSHIHSIDQKTPAAAQMRRCAAFELDEDGSRWMPARPRCDEDSDQSLVVRVIAGGSDANKSEYRLVGLQVATAAEIGPEIREQLTRFTSHAACALENTESSGRTGGRWINRAFPRMATSSRRKKWASILMAGGLVIAAFFPVPLVVDAPAIIRPAQSQIVSAPRDAVVETIAVTHGQSVRRGDTLMTMSDPSLEEQISSLVGRRSVLVQQQSRWTEALVGTSSAQLDRFEQAQNERSLVAEEIQALDAQLAILGRVKESLVIHADRDGVVDGWQVESRLQSRPVRRGDGLMRVIASDSDWLVDARVPQNRIGHLQNVSRNDESSRDFTAQVSLDADPGQIMEATLVQIGPAVVSEHNPVPATSALLRLSDVGAEMIRGNRRNQDLSGAPARVMFRCGHRCVGYILFQDLIQTVRGTARLYFAAVPTTEFTDSMIQGDAT